MIFNKIPSGVDFSQPNNIQGDIIWVGFTKTLVFTSRISCVTISSTRWCSGDNWADLGEGPEPEMMPLHFDFVIIQWLVCAFISVRKRTVRANAQTNRWCRFINGLQAKVEVGLFCESTQIVGLSKPTTLQLHKPTI